MIQRSLWSSLSRWFDEYFLFALAAFLIAFIPLNPKIPLWSPIEQYIVRVRMEDFLILGTVLLWGVQVLRRKVKWFTPFFWFVAVYAIVGALSTFSAVFITKTVPMEFLHIGKTLLHYVRYMEYFSLFFVMFSAIRTRKHALIALGVLIATVLAITVYGYGQKFFYWPVYSTMNREFSKGVRLYLTQFARVQSTFGGHYDMAAYLVVTLPLLLGLAYHSAQVWWKKLTWVAFWGGSWLLILSASRTPFAAYVAAVALVIVIAAALKKTWPDRVGFFLKQSLVVFFWISLLFIYFGEDLSERLSHVVGSSKMLTAWSESINQARRNVVSDQTLAQIPLSPMQVRALLPKTSPPSGAISTDDIAAAAAAAATQTVASRSDQPPTPVKKPSPKPSVAPGQAPPVDVYVDIPDEIVTSTTSATGVTTVTTTKRPRIYSKCALEKELSLCIRLETLWPRAIEGPLTNPLLGSGYATLTKENVEEFTEADSTDNNYLRTLGETGALGFLAFYGSIVLMLVLAFKHFTDRDELTKGLSIGFFAGSVGLLLNAVYIDVYAASKVAQSYWAISGLFFAVLALNQDFLAPKWLPFQPKQNTTAAASHSAAPPKKVSTRKRS